MRFVVSHLKLLQPGKRKHVNGLKHQTLPLMGTTRPKAAEKISFMFENTWNKIIDWFHDRSERNKLVRNFNTTAREAFIEGTVPTMLKASFSKGVAEYKHAYSAWFNTGFRIQALSGRRLSRDEMIYIGNVVLHNEQLVRRLIVLGWDTLEVHDDVGTYGCRWKLSEYANIGLMIE